MVYFQGLEKNGVLQISGAARDRGYQHGSELTAPIKSLIDCQYSWYDRCCKLSKDQISRLSRKYMTATEQYSSDVAEEIKAMAEGAGCKQEEIMMLTAFIELTYRNMVLAAGCTGFLATGSATENGKTYVGQSNDDFPALWLDRKASVLINIKQDHGPSILTYTYPGIPAMMGMNSEGIGLCITGVLCEKSQIGVPTMIIAREILNKKTIEDAIKAITRANRAESANYLIADRNGELYDIEATPDSIDYLYADDCMAHTNHFLSKNLNIQKDLVLTMTPDTLIRKNRMAKLLKQEYGRLKEEVLMGFYRDHVNYPNSICRHLDENARRDYSMITFDSMIFAPAEKEMWIARGNPCQNEFQKYTLQ